MFIKALGVTLLAIVLVGCSTPVPVSAKFPQAPDRLLVECAPLLVIKEDAKLSDVAKTVADNYGLYHDCAIKHGGWIEWYQTQRRIFDSAK
jgi:hypothetical protein